MEFFFNKTLSINTLFHFRTCKIGNFLTFTHPTPILVSSATWFITPTTSVNHQRLLGISEDPNSHYSSELYCYFCRPPSRLINFFPKVTFFKKKRTTRYTKKELNRTLCLFFLICFCSFFYICMYFSLFVFCSFVLWDSWLFSFISLLLQFCVSNIRYTIPEILGPTYVEKRKILYFGLVLNLFQHLISPNQDDLSYSARTFISGLQNGWTAKPTLFGLRRRPEQKSLWPSLLSDAF